MDPRTLRGETKPELRVQLFTSELVQRGAEYDLKRLQLFGNVSCVAHVSIDTLGAQRGSFIVYSGLEGQILFVL